MKMQMQNRFISFLIVSLALTSFLSVNAQGHHIPFTVKVRTDKGSVPMAFRMAMDSPFTAVGYEEYNRPAIPVQTEGEIFIPDSVVAPDGRRLEVQWISRGSFQGCLNITKVHLPRTIRSISDFAFQGCESLREITLSDSLQVIYPQAFSGCFALKRVTLSSPYPPHTYQEGTFEESCFNTATIVVPFGSADNYRKDNLFSHFRYHAEHIPTFPSEE